MYWYQHFQFENREQYEEWRKWAEEEVKDKKVVEEIDLQYGFTYRYKKEGELF
jgi:hypothetical protein